MSDGPAHETQPRDPGLAVILKERGVEDVQHHLFLCMGPKCCSEEQGNESWEFLKARLRELKLVDKSVYRTRVGCLRICKAGPIAVHYPTGKWFTDATPEKLEAIIQSEILQKGPPVEALAVNPLKG